MIVDAPTRRRNFGNVNVAWVNEWAMRVTSTTYHVRIDVAPSLFQRRDAPFAKHINRTRRTQKRNVSIRKIERDRSATRELSDFFVYELVFESFGSNRLIPTHGFAGRFLWSKSGMFLLMIPTGVSPYP